MLKVNRHHFLFSGPFVGEQCAFATLAKHYECNHLDLSWLVSWGSSLDGQDDEGRFSESA